MKKNLYYKANFKRLDSIKENLLFIFLFVISWPRLLLEVFVRKNFGERYFSMLVAVCSAIFLAFVPYWIEFFINFSLSSSFIDVILKNITWYAYLAAFLYFSYQRQLECRREENLFDFSKFSLYNGDIHPKFREFTFRGKMFNTRGISTKLEPAFFFLIGLALTLCLQKVGLLIMYCSICYGVGYYSEYRHGDHFVLDKIDEMICNEEMVASFVHERPPSDTRGFEARGGRPLDPDFRRKVVDSFFEETEDSVEAR